MQDDAGKTPETPQEDDDEYMQYLKDRCYHLEGELRVVATQHQIARDVATDMSLKLTAVEAKLREAEAKATLADEYRKEVMFPIGIEGKITIDWRNYVWYFVSRYDALKQPKASAS